jgi:hypothetical protein
MQKIGQTMYAQQQATAGTRGPGFSGNGTEDAAQGGPEGRPAEEGTVEGEFREV